MGRFDEFLPENTPTQSTTIDPLKKTSGRFSEFTSDIESVPTQKEIPTKDQPSEQNFGDIIKAGFKTAQPRTFLDVAVAQAKDPGAGFRAVGELAPFAGFTLGGPIGAAVGGGLGSLSSQIGDVLSGQQIGPLEAGLRASGATFLGGLGGIGGKSAGTLTAPSVKAAGQALGAVERRAGLKTAPQIVPKGQEAIVQTINEAEKILASPGGVAKQTLRNMKQKLGDIVDQGAEEVGKTNHALASAAQEAFTKALNKATPGRELAANTFKQALEKQALIGSLKQGGKQVLKVGGVLGPAGFGLKLLIDALKGKGGDLNAARIGQ